MASSGNSRDSQKRRPVEPEPGKKNEKSRDLCCSHTWVKGFHWLPSEETLETQTETVSSHLSEVYFAAFMLFKTDKALPTWSLHSPGPPSVGMMVSGPHHRHTQKSKGETAFSFTSQSDVGLLVLAEPSCSYTVWNRWPQGPLNGKRGIKESH